MDFVFALSRGLFSSTDVDTGTRMLLRVFSQKLDDDKKAGLPPPRRILDAGSGTGVIGICVLRALFAAGALPGEIHLRAQDRDELARIVTEYNARENGLPPSALEARTEALLREPPAAPWDLILSNVPAKAGKPVLLDFISRSALRLSPGGRVLLVVVNPLADLFRARIGELGLPVFCDETGKGHTVFMYGKGASPPPPREAAAERAGNDGPGLSPLYFRTGGDYELEGIGYHIDALQGIAGFDSPGDAVRAGAKLVSRLGTGLRSGAGGPARGSLLTHEPGQGHFPVWLLRFALGVPELRGLVEARWVLSGRNILSLEAARGNMVNTGSAPECLVVPAVDLLSGGKGLREALGQGEDGYGLVVAVPEPAPRAGLLNALWEGLGGLLKTGGTGLVVFPSSEAERFDRKKPKPFVRLGDLKRKGFRALAYAKTESSL